MNTKKLIAFLSIITCFSLSIIFNPQMPIDVPAPTGLINEDTTMM